MTFGEKLREIRESKGFTQKTLAEASGQKQQTIAGWETGNFFPAIHALDAICKVLGVKLRIFEDCEFAASEEKRGRGRPKKS